MGLTGWCSTHGTLSHVRCPVNTGQRTFPDPARKGTFFTTAERSCTCPCHNRDLLIQEGTR